MKNLSKGLRTLTKKSLVEHYRWLAEVRCVLSITGVGPNPMADLLSVNICLSEVML